MSSVLLDDHTWLVIDLSQPIAPRVQGSKFKSLENARKKNNNNNNKFKKFKNEAVSLGTNTPVPSCEGMAGWGNQGSSWTPPSALMSRTMPAFRLALAPQPGIPHSVSGLQVSPELTNRPPCIPTSRRSTLVFIPLK